MNTNLQVFVYVLGYIQHNFRYEKKHFVFFSNVKYRVAQEGRGEVVGLGQWEMRDKGEEMERAQGSPFLPAMFPAYLKEQAESRLRK